MEIKKKILIASGGGGHFSPALSIIESLPEEIEVLVVGRKYSLEGDRALSLEYQTTKDLGIPFVAVTSGRLQRKFTKHTVSSLLKMPVGFFQSYRIVKKFKPNLILSFGGYISLPIVFAGWMLHVPVVIHEQTLGAGLANKIASFFAKKICVSFESSIQYFPKNKTVVTGNPIKKSLSNKKLDQMFILPKNLPVLLVTGGSSGSHAINGLIEECIQNLVNSYCVIHQTGDAKEYEDYKRLEILKSQLAENVQKNYILTKFISPDNFQKILSLSDLVISRAGINTISEIILMGKPTLLIPLPFAQNNEQFNNARFVKDIGLGEVLEQKSLTPEILEGEIKKMFENKNTYLIHAKDAQKLIPKNATEKVLAQIEEFVT